MTTVIISGESHTSKEDHCKHEQYFKDVDVLFIESLLSDKTESGRGVLYPLYWFGSLIHGMSYYVFQGPRGQYYTPSYEKYGLMTYLAIDKSVEEIYNTAETKLKVATILFTSLYVTLNLYIVSAMYSIIFSAAIIGVLAGVGESGRRKRIVVSVLLFILLSSLIIALVFGGIYEDLTRLHKSLYALMLLFVGLPYAYFSVIALAPSTDEGRERKMVDRIDEIMREGGYKKPMLICGDGHTEGMKKYLEERGYKTEIRPSVSEIASEMKKSRFRSKFFSSTVLALFLVSVLIASASLLLAFSINLAGTAFK